jgi:hypothetical protein
VADSECTCTDKFGNFCCIKHSTFEAYFHDKKCILYNGNYGNTGVGREEIRKWLVQELCSEEESAGLVARSGRGLFYQRLSMPFVGVDEGFHDQLIELYLTTWCNNIGTADCLRGFYSSHL